MTDGERTEPVRWELAGVELVTIPVTHYAELLECRRLVSEAGLTRSRFVADMRSRIERDPEVAAFLAECLGTQMLKDTYSLCLDRFGAERTPGKSTIQRYWKRLGKR